MNSENYGTHIKHIRQKMGLTQNQVAEALGVTPGYISNVENNRTAMSLRILTYYAKLCGCSLDSLVGTLDPEYSETALDRKLYNAIMQLDVYTKEKLLKTIELWKKRLRKVHTVETSDALLGCKQRKQKDFRRKRERNPN